MTTCCNKCGSNGKCGCNDSVLHIPLTCPTPQCDNTNDCPETFSECCVVNDRDTFGFIDPEGSDPISFVIYENEKLCDTLQRLLIYINCKGAVLPFPYGVKSNTITSTTINVSWYQLIDVEGYKVYISPATNPATWTLAGTVINNTTPNLTITGLTPNTSYYVYVQTYIDDVVSCPSVTLILTTKL